ncbi:hypothetical protein [Leisingera caerulea]|uniref:hypothetical protein n=1 Tax=Leisingera caerulea TaxID=506591 RepID=UPI0003FF6B87|nr:hypothetical protein [Leisingera caerulea]
MPLELLLALVAGGITAIAVLLHVTGRSRQAVLTAESSRAAWLRQYPQDRVQNVLPAASGHAALIAADSGPGLVWAFGADSVARHLGGAAIAESAGGLRISFKDFSAPGVSVALTRAERARWQAVIASGGETA